MNPMRRISLPKDFEKANFWEASTRNIQKSLHCTSLFFFWKSKTVTIILDFFGLSQFQWVILNIFSANAASVNSFSDITSYFIAALFFLFSLVLASSNGVPRAHWEFQSNLDSIDTNRIFSSYSNFRRKIRYRIDTISNFPNPEQGWFLSGNWEKRKK